MFNDSIETGWMTSRAETCWVICSDEQLSKAIPRALTLANLRNVWLERMVQAGKETEGAERANEQGDEG